METQETAPTRRDLEEELTELEWQASQGSLDQAQNQRLQELRQQRASLLADVKERTDQPDQAGDIVSGDDSP